MNKVFTCVAFEGHYPVGTAAVVVAESIEEAKRMLEWELRKSGLGQEVPLDKIHEIDISSQSCNILCDGYVPVSIIYFLPT